MTDDELREEMSRIFVDDLPDCTKKELILGNDKQQKCYNNPDCPFCGEINE